MIKKLIYFINIFHIIVLVGVFMTFKMFIDYLTKNYYFLLSIFFCNVYIKQPST